MLRPALQAAVAVARAGETADPPEAAPGALRPFLTFARLSDRALATIRRVVDEDGAFRARVRRSTSEEEVGRASWLFLDRPPGWADELARAVAGAAGVSRQREEARRETSAARRAVRADAAVRQAEAGRDEARRAAADAREELAAERRARRAAETELGRARKALARAEAEREAHREEVTAAEARSADARRSVEELEARVLELERELDVARRQAAESGAAGGSRAVSELADAAEALAAAARAVAAAAGEESIGVEDAGPAPAPGRGRREAVRRAPVRLPAGLLEDSPEAARAAVRTPRLVVLVDGYNVSLSQWAERPLEEQRRRLVDALERLAATTGVDVRVVFDGSQTGSAPVATRPRRGVQAEFTPAGVEADEVLVERVESLPPDRPVAVVTDDRRVQREVRARGAAVLTTAQLVHLLRT